MKKAFVLFLMIILSSIFIVGCGASTPGAVAKAAIEAANKGDYKGASEYLHPAAKMFVSDSVWDEETHKKTVTSIDITKEDIKDKEAHVTLKLHYKDGSTYDDSFNLEQTNGEWLITP